MRPLHIGARRLGTLGILAGAAAVVSTISAASTGPATDAGAAADDGWVLGVAFLVLPLFAAGLARSAAGSVLLRPAGAVALVLAAAGAAVHVGVSVDERGPAGWLFGAPSVLCVLAIGAAVAAGPDRRPADVDVDADVDVVQPSRSWPAGGHGPDVVQGPPLDVLGPLRDARDHARAAVLAWIVVVAVVLVVTAPVLRLLGWPTVEATLDARVASVTERHDEVVVGFAAEHDGATLHWEWMAGSTQWEQGDRRSVHLDDRGKVHVDQQLGLAGVPLLVPVAFVGGFALFALRRAWGLLLAAADAGRGADEPRLGYVAVVLPPRQWRPLAAVWWDDPTGGDDLAGPDAVYRIDGDTGEQLQSLVPGAVVHRAWVDTGLWAGAKPRWIGADRGVLVPHRRAVLGRSQFRLAVRRTRVEEVVPLRHSAPDPVVGPPIRRSPSSLRGMLAWRLLAVPCAIAASFLAGPGGDAVRQLQ